MNDGKFNSLNCNTKEMVCIDTYRILDSCRDKDCFENAKVYLTCFGQEIIERTGTVRAKYAKIVSTYIDIDEVPFNCGFYQLTIKFYVKLILEGCVGAGNIQEFEGISVLEKKVILFGGTGSVHVFKSGNGCSSSDTCGKCESATNLPVAVVEAVDPIVLDVKVVEPTASCVCHVCCSCCDIPSHVTNCVCGELSDSSSTNVLTVSLGIFSVIRLERPAQLLVNAAEYCVPEKHCVEAKDNDPCSVFNSMPFPIKEFCSTSAKWSKENGCGCN